MDSCFGLSTRFRNHQDIQTTSTGSDMQSTERTIVSLEREQRTSLCTAEAAAYHLNRAQQTLRLWAMRENGPIRPIRVNGRLAWPVAELRRVLHVQAAA
jgi:hypothetical protein